MVLTKELGQKDSIQNAIDREFIYNSLDAIPGFVIVGFIFFFRKFESIKFTSELQILSVIFVLLPITRLIIVKLYEKFLLSLTAARILVQIGILITAITWSTISLLVITEYELQNPITNISHLIASAALAIATVSYLSYCIKLAYMTGIIMLFPNIFYLFYLYYVRNNTQALHFAVTLSICTLYLARHYYKTYKHILSRFEFADRLHTKNKVLIESRDTLLAEYAKSQNTIRVKTIGEISDELTHEINNPLAIINGNIDLIIKNLNSDTVDKTYIETKLEKSRSAIARIIKIISTLSFFSGKNSLENTFVIKDINELIDETISYCSEKLKLYQIELEFENPAVYKVNCIPTEIFQVLLNLISNSIRYVNDLPSTDRKILIKTATERNSLKIYLSNSGPKITETYIPYLFKSTFFNNSIDGKIGLGIGSSIGLVASKQIVENHGGLMYYDSESQFCTFVIELPLLN